VCVWRKVNEVVEREAERAGLRRVRKLKKKSKMISKGDIKYRR
jgi:hypothetical protein